MVKDPFIKKLWISLGIIAASVIIAAGLVYYYLGDIAAQAHAIVTDRTTVETQTSAVANLANLERGAVQAVRYQSAMNQLLPDQYGLVAFGQWFSDEGQEYNVTANASLQGSMIQPAGSIPGTASFTFEVDGPLSNLITFLNTAAAKSSTFLFSFNSFDLSVDGANYKITGQGTLFFQ